jgi:oxygen-independent coproporphyrinogen-3 oxidase
MTKGIYIHIPFCNRKCGYCSFYSVSDLKLKTGFLQALSEEITYKKEAYPLFFEGGEATLYIGGGNPELLDEFEIGRLFEITDKLPFKFSEITIEANPDSITDNKLKLYRQLGINRLSVGIQAFDDEVLRFLGRNHSLADAVKALDAAGKYFENFSIDLIGGTPTSGLERDWEKEFGYIERYRPSHVSFYLLSIEKGSDFFGNVVVDEDLQSLDYELFGRYMRDMDYDHYEISNFCKPEYECRHNQLYWERNEYMGFGPSAVTFVRTGGSPHSETQEIRIKNVSNINSYIRVPALSEIEVLSIDDSFFETIFLSLRMAKGLDIRRLEKIFPGRSAGLEERFINLERFGYIERCNYRWRIPEKHFIISSEIVLELIKEMNYA